MWSSFKITFGRTLRISALLAGLYATFTIGSWLGFGPLCASGTAHTSTSPSRYKSWSLDAPIVMAHRGGPSPGFPENCIETFKRSSQAGALLMELDVRTTKDGHFVVMHDNNISRTTNGRGLVSELPLSYLKTLYLKDFNGTLTGFRVPTLKEVLSWTIGTSFIALDLKGSIDAASLVGEIHESGAASYSIIIASSLAVAEQYSALSSKILLSVPIENERDIQKVFTSKLARFRVIGYAGQTEPSQSLYSALQASGIPALLNTVGVLDRRAQQDGPKFYRALLHRGASIVSTDFPWLIRP